MPTEDGIRFLTWYDYRTRFGVLGRLFDALVFRPLLGWATAWSFDRLRLWIERGLDPATLRERSVVHAIARVTLAFVFLYHGVVPKLLARHPDEIVMLAGGGVPHQWIEPAIVLLGVVEIGWAALLLLRWRARWALAATAAAMPALLIAVAAGTPGFLVAAFTPVTLNAVVAALAVVGWLVSRDLPSAARCRREQPAEGS